MAHTIDPFEIVNKEAEEKLKNEVAKQTPYQIEAFQIIRIKKSEMNEHRREVIDTIMVYKGQVETAQKKAIGKARRLGNCMVMMKMEQTVGCFHEAQSTSENDEFTYYKSRK